MTVHLIKSPRIYYIAWGGLVKQAMPKEGSLRYSTRSIMDAENVSNSARNSTNVACGPLLHPSGAGRIRVQTTAGRKVPFDARHTSGETHGRPACTERFADGGGLR